MFSNHHNKSNTGGILVVIIIFSSIFLIIIGGLLSLITYQNKLSKSLENKDIALEIAEAGINYYRWHLAHAETDYADGCSQNPTEPWCTGGAIINNCIAPGTCGPYQHTYYDSITNDAIGSFRLVITPPTTGSTIVTINSTGWVTGESSHARDIEVRYGKRSWSQYAVLLNSFYRSSVTFNAPVHSNAGIRFDGVANNIISSNVATFDDPDHSGVNEFGVHTHVNAPPGVGITDSFRPNEAPPAAVMPDRSDVFRAGRIAYPTPAGLKNFGDISLVLDTMLTTAGTDTVCNISNKGCIISKSNKKGWHIQLLNNNTFQYQEVNTTESCGSTATGKIATAGNWTVMPMPEQGVIFVKDDTWIDGTINNNHVTIAAGETPLVSGDANIWLNDDVLYTNKDGQDTIGLTAQNNILLGLYSDNDLEIDGSLIARDGAIKREYYPSSCNATYYLRSNVTWYGSAISNQRIGTYYSSPAASGYQNTIRNYDSNLLYGPPPFFPKESNYTFISWSEE